eukprot:TRINITY_DN4269_c0_g1_i1.p1 TRINITY_DN4269_c0_g1~~TRINITY_DN4269_c0_g1_i1.p1  ORF type:complete len:236 (+),score=28.83 TRINITY_DN4269_c0_g1_i1:28-708(+)
MVTVKRRRVANELHTMTQGNDSHLFDLNNHPDPFALPSLEYPADQALSGILLELDQLNNSNLFGNASKENNVEKNVDRFCWDGAEFHVFIEMCLEYLVSLGPDNSQFTSETRLRYPQNEGIFAYFYRGGSFFPSAKQDGLYWRQSTCYAPMRGSRMRRMYFYSLVGQIQLRRHVHWLADFPEIYLVVYKKNYEGQKIYLDDLSGPDNFHWITFIQQVYSFHSSGSS